MNPYKRRLAKKKQKKLEKEEGQEYVAKLEGETVVDGEEVGDRADGVDEGVDEGGDGVVDEVEKEEGVEKMGILEDVEIEESVVDAEQVHKGKDEEVVRVDQTVCTNEDQLDFLFEDAAAPKGDGKESVEEDANDAGEELVKIPSWVQSFIDDRAEGPVSPKPAYDWGTLAGEPVSSQTMLESAYQGEGGIAVSLCDGENKVQEGGQPHEEHTQDEQPRKVEMASPPVLKVVFSQECPECEEDREINRDGDQNDNTKCWGKRKNQRSRRKRGTKPALNMNDGNFLCDVFPRPSPSTRGKVVHFVLHHGAALVKQTSNVGRETEAGARDAYNPIMLSCGGNYATLRNCYTVLEPSCNGIDDQVAFNIVTTVYS